MTFTFRKITSHLLFWIEVFLFYMFSSGSRELFGQLLETTLFRLPLLMIAAYLFNYWQVPHYLKHKRYFIFGISVLLVSLVLVVLYRCMGYYHLDQYCEEGPYPQRSLEDFPLYGFSFHFPGLMMYFIKQPKSKK